MFFVVKASHGPGHSTILWRASCSLRKKDVQSLIGMVHCQKEGMLLQSLCWRCVECAIHHKRDACKEQHPYNGANKQ